MDGDRSFYFILSVMTQGENNIPAESLVSRTMSIKSDFQSSCDIGLIIFAGTP